MTNEQFRNKGLTVRMMYATAQQNGKNGTISDMIRTADRLHRIETTLSRLAEDECNYPVYDEAKQERLENLAKKIITDEIGCNSYTQRDPRGYCIRMYLHDEDGRRWANSWDGETSGLNW